MPKHPAHEDQRQQWLIEELRAPEVAGLCKPGKGESIFSRLDEVDRMLSSDDDLVKEWIESGADLDDLAKLLQERPRLIDVKLVRKQLFHLRALGTGFMPLADSLGGLAADKQTAAQEHLKRIAEGMVRGLLPGYSVEIAVDAPNGRPREVDHEELLQDLNGLLVALQFLLEKDSFLLLRKKQESQHDFTLRISKIVQDLYENSHLSFGTSISPYKPFLNRKGQPVVYLDPRSLDLASAWRIAKRAIQKRRSASFKLLVLGILEYHYQISARALENHLARLKVEYIDRFRSLLERFPRFGRRF
jgi:hypothetical protein